MDKEIQDKIRKRKAERKKKNRVYLFVFLIIVLAITLICKGCASSAEKKRIAREQEAKKQEQIKIQNELNKEFKGFLSDNEIEEYKDVLLFENKKTPDNYFENIALIGDSISTGYNLFGKFEKTRVWAEGSVDTRGIIDRQIGYNAEGNKVLIKDAIASIHPKAVYSMLGTNGISWMGEELFEESYTAFINECKKADPKMTFVIVSIPPITAEREKKKDYPSNETIDKYNKFLLKVAKKNKCKFLFASIVQKDEDGALKPEYTSGDGIHWSYETYDITLDYIKKHGIK